MHTISFIDRSVKYDSYLIVVLFVASFPSSVLEVSEDEVSDWLSPKDLGIGKTVNINGRKFLM